MRVYPAELAAAAGLRGPVVKDDLLFAVERAARIAPVQAVRAGVVLGDLHIRSAALHAHRALREGRNQADRPEVEFTRYLAGERQIRRALAKAGLGEAEPAAVAVALGPRAADAIRYLLDQVALAEDDGAIDGDDARRAAWGFTAAQLAATTPAAREHLVLEAVALVDLG